LCIILRHIKTSALCRLASLVCSPVYSEYVLPHDLFSCNQQTSPKMSQETLPVDQPVVASTDPEKETTSTEKSAHLAPNHDPEAQLPSSATSATGVDSLAEKPQAEDEAAGPPRTVTGFVWVLVVIAILSSTFLFALDNTVVADVQVRDRLPKDTWCYRQPR
jgi:hypothetical protein